MSNKSIGEMISSLRKEKGMTQNDLAEKMNVTDKAVSKWERNLSCPDINSIPKMGYDHDKIVEKLINYLKKRIIDSNILKILFPSDFTIPELQKVYEQLLDIQIDRRNFRKRILNSGYIVSTGDVNEGNMGRPAKLYRFNDNKEEGNIF